MSAVSPRHRSLFCLSIASAQRNAGILKPKPIPPTRVATEEVATERQDSPSYRLPSIDVPLDVSAAEAARGEGKEPEEARAFAPFPIEASIADFHWMTYVEWGDPDSSRTIVCVHGFARNGRDFDRFGERLASDARVVCPDIVGRGRSDRLTDPPLDGAVVFGGVVLVDYGYNFAQFQLDVTALIARLGVDEVDWVGTSLGGLLGMMMAASPNSPVRRLVMNDVGPKVPGTMLDTMVGYLGDESVFNTFEELEAFLRKHYIGKDKFGELSDAEVRHMSKFSERKLPKGKIGLAFDHEAIRVSKWTKDNFPHLPFADVEMWEVWDRVRCPVLALRGENSLVLTKDTAARMHQEGAKATVVTIPECGHAPALMEEAQIALVDHWLKTLTIDRGALGALRASVLNGKSP